MPVEGAAPAAVDTGTVAASAAEPVAASAAEPVAAPAVEPVAETPIAEPVVEAEPVPWLPDHGEFDFSTWDGKDLGSFPEVLRPWLEAAVGRVGENHTEALNESQAGKDRWESMFNTIANGEDDPRIGEAQAETRALQALMDEKDVAFQHLEKRVAQVVDEQTNRYVDWFAETHPDVVKNEPLFNSMASLSEELNVNWHVALEVQSLGAAAVEEAQKRAKVGKDSEDTLELLRLKYAGQRPAKPSRDVQTSQALAASSERPPPAPRPGPPEGVPSDLNANIRNVVRAAVASTKRGTKRSR